MRQQREFDDILNECMERLLSGETLEQCLRSFPDYASQLKPLLETTLEVKKVSALQPSLEFKEKARKELHTALREMKPKRRPFFILQPRWAIAITAVILFLLAGGGTVAAGSVSMPDEPFYPVKLATEQMRLKLTPSALGKAELYARFANVRVLEIEQMAKENKPQQIVETAQRLDSVLADLAATQGSEQRNIMMAPPLGAADQEGPPTIAPAPPMPTTQKGTGIVPPMVSTGNNRQAMLNETVRNQAIANLESLRSLLDTVPESSRPALLEAIAISESGYAEVLESIK
ncbi:MAG: DUF5667 domain-containing protein [Chloroflexota bacterium]